MRKRILCCVNIMNRLLVRTVSVTTLIPVWWLCLLTEGMSVIFLQCCRDRQTLLHNSWLPQGKKQKDNKCITSTAPASECLSSKTQQIDTLQHQHNTETTGPIQCVTEIKWAKNYEYNETSSWLLLNKLKLILCLFLSHPSLVQCVNLWSLDTDLSRLQHARRLFGCPRAGLDWLSGGRCGTHSPRWWRLVCVEAVAAGIAGKALRHFGDPETPHWMPGTAWSLWGPVWGRRGKC